MGSTVDNEVIDLLSAARAANPDRIFVPIDKDIKRRATMSETGYLYRLRNCYSTDPEHYVIAKDTSLKRIIKKRTALMRTFIPKTFRNDDPFALARFPSCYHLYKSKCLIKPTGHWARELPCNH